MTVLILAHRRIKGLFPIKIFRGFNFGALLPTQTKGKILVPVFLCVSGVAVIVYLLSLYFTFQDSFMAREQEIYLDKLGREVRLREIEASNIETSLAKDAEISAAMEKVSSVRYIKTASELSYK